MNEVCSRNESCTRTKYTYDGLNRLTGISYNVSGATGVPATASVGLTYGTNASQFDNGRLITMTDGPGSESYTYNNLGQLTQLQKVIGTTTYTTSYAYNLANELIQIAYPSGRVVQQSVDAIGRLCEIAPSTTGCGTSNIPYATGYGYNVAGEVTGFKYGNGIYASLGFSPDRLQLTCLDYSTTNRSGNCTHDSTTKLGLTYSYGSAGSNNGQISGISDYVQPGRNITYTFDSLYRMTNASTAGSTAYPAWGLSESYDRYGNRTAQSISSGCVSPMTCPTNSESVNSSTNHLTGSNITYDLSGNMTNDALNTLTYDGEGRAVTASGGLGTGTYTYDGHGLRVEKVSGSTTTLYIFSGSKVIAEYAGGAAPSSPTVEYIYAGAVLLAKINSSGTFYYQQDHLSNRMVTNSTGGVVAEMGHFPFGESWYNASNDKLYFTTYEYDAESGNHFAMARIFGNRLGRFLSPDPVSGALEDPQSLNHYTYSSNDPCNETDPFGLDSCTFSINLKNNAGLSQDQVNAILSRINALFSATVGTNGDSVSAVLASDSSSANYTINLTNSGWLLDTFEPGAWGYTSILMGANVEINNIKAYPTDVPFTINAGNAATHEFGHLIFGGLFGSGDLNYDKNNPNTMMYDKAPGSQQIFADDNPSSPLWKFSLDQIETLYKACVKKNPSAPKGGGLFGGGIGDGSAGVGEFVGDDFTVTDIINSLYTVTTSYTLGCPQGTKPDGHGGCK